MKITLKQFAHGAKLLLNTSSNRARSRYDRGVVELALMILGDGAFYGRAEEELPATWKELEKLLLCGAESWEQYVYGGRILVSDYHIAKLLLTPSLFKRWENSPSNFVPNHVHDGLTMLDCEVYAAKKAVGRICEAYYEVIRFKRSYEVEK